MLNEEKAMAAAIDSQLQAGNPVYLATPSTMDRMSRLETR